MHAWSNIKKKVVIHFLLFSIGHKFDQDRHLPMLSSTGFSPQIGGLLSEVAVGLNNIKKLTHTRYAQQRQKYIPTQQNELNLASTPVADNITEPYTSLLEDLGLHHLPKDWKELLATPLSVGPNHCDNDKKWFESHVSSESFFQNKHGFSNQLLLSKKPARLKSSLLSMFTNQPQLFTQSNLQIRPLHTMSEKRIQKLEGKANLEAHSPRTQAEYLRALVTEDPLYVIRRYESGQYAVDEAVRREYLKALVLTDRISQAELDQMGAVSSSGHVIQGASNSSSFGPVPLSGSEDSPIHVIMQSQKGAFFKEQLWNTIRFLIGLFLILSVIEAQLQMKMSTNQKEILPDSADRRCRFSDVQGVDEAKQELQEIVEFLRNPEKFRRLGGKMPQGVLLIGAPGTGKTMLAKAVAGEAGVPFFFCSGSEFDEMFVGVGAARVRNLFAAAREHAPCIIFIDELDAIGGTRVVHDHQPYSRMTLNQLLVELDGFDKTEGIIVIGATNFPEILDKALVRPGRFDTKIDVPMPDVKARHDILKVHFKNVQVADNVNVEVLARGTPGFSGADLANLVNQAAIRAATDGDCAVTTKHLEFAKDKIIMGPERKSAVVEAENRKLVAYHEGGHAIVAIFTPGALPVHKATIMPRGQALGMVSQLPEKDELNWSRKQLLAKLDVCMAGRVAEELTFGRENITTGAASDAEQATKIAKAMVSNYGMSDKVGMIQVKEGDHLSPDTRSLIENEVKALLKDAYDRAKSLLQSHSKEHKCLAEALLKYETLDAEEIKLVIQGKALSRTL